MSKAGTAFHQSILDAENLLSHFDKLNTQPPPPENEVLKRAGLIMAMTAWETYVEDRVSEACEQRLSDLPDRSIADFVQSRLNEEIKRLHNPNANKTISLFRDYAGVELADKLAWNNFTPAVVKERLDYYLGLRGDIVHRSRPMKNGPPSPDPVKKDELEKAIRFLKNLVEATEVALSGAKAA